ncbi:hypothetical protein L1887_59364 [Cichorium endivia]|nr:hypothetical protein L1887_59364 [Cichorium endivia]
MLRREVVCMRYGVFAIGALRCLLYVWFLLKGIQKGRMGELGNIALGGAFSMGFQVLSVVAELTVRARKGSAISSMYCKIAWFLNLMLIIRLDCARTRRHASSGLGRPLWMKLRLHEQEVKLRVFA